MQTPRYSARPAIEAANTVTHAAAVPGSSNVGRTNPRKSAIAAAAAAIREIACRSRNASAADPVRAAYSQYRKIHSSHDAIDSEIASPYTPNRSHRIVLSTIFTMTAPTVSMTGVRVSPSA